MGSWCIVYLASPRDRRIGTVFGGHRKFDILAASIRIARQVFPSIDIYVFHEDLEDADKAALPGVKEFLPVEFHGFEDLFVQHTFPKGYVLMCRFFSGQLQRLPQLQAYTHYMRLDDDSYFQPPWITESHVASLCAHDYVYRSVFYDLKDHQALFDMTLQFVRESGYGHFVPQLLRWLDEKGVVRNDRYTGLAPYNNFHLSSLRLWNHSLVSAYVDRLEALHGCLRHGWLDANIHAMIIWVLAPLIGMHVHHDGSFGYRHNKHVSRLDSPAIVWDASLPFYPSSD